MYRMVVIPDMLYNLQAVALVKRQVTQLEMAELHYEK